MRPLIFQTFQLTYEIAVINYKLLISNIYQLVFTRESLGLKILKKKNLKKIKL